MFVDPLAAGIPPSPNGELLTARKSTLLKCVAQLIPLDEGKPFLLHKTPESWGFPTWRSKVLYVPQRPRTPLISARALIEIAINSGTPLEFFKQARDFGSRKGRVHADDPVSLGEDWGLPPRVWHEEWTQASGGEAQRAMLAIAVALKPDILLLDEPTSYPHRPPLLHGRLTRGGPWMKLVFKRWRKRYGIES